MKYYLAKSVCVCLNPLVRLWFHCLRAVQDYEALSKRQQLHVSHGSMLYAPVQERRRASDD